MDLGWRGLLLVAVVPGATAGYQPVGGLTNLVDAILESGLPANNPLLGRAMATNALLRPEDPTLPFSIFSQPLTNEAIAQTDPEMVKALVGRWAELGNQYPETLKTLVGLGPTPRGPTFASVRALTGTGSQHQLGINPEYNLNRLRNSVRQGIERGWNVGAQQMSTLPPESGFIDPVASIGTHEFGHALQNRLNHFIDVSENPGLHDLRSQVLDQMVAQNFNPHTMYSEYAKEGQANNLLHMLKPEVASLYDPADIRNLNNLGARAGASEFPLIRPSDVSIIDPYLKRQIAQEPFSEAFAMRNTPRYPLGVFERLTPQSKNALSAGENIANLLAEAKASGFRGAVAPELLFKGAGGVAAGLLAPKIIDALVPNKKSRLSKALKGATEGAGYGSILGPEGTLAGAGIGALASQIFG
jgi:hypothetical protein